MSDKPDSRDIVEFLRALRKPAERGDIDIEQLAPEIEALRETAMRYVRAIDEDSGAIGAGIDLDAAAICYVRKLDAIHANRPDYAAIAREAERARETSGN